jgi:hypothetical protein
VRQDRQLRALLVCYTFPPVGGAGVARVAKLAKYLPGHGVEPSVLTASNPSVPVMDPSLLRDVSADLRVIRARTLEPPYGVKGAVWQAEASQRPGVTARARRLVTGAARQLLVPDSQVLWQPAAQRALSRELGERRPEVVVISGPPFSQFLLALTARRHRGVAVVLDYRDEWSTYRTTYEMMGRAGAAVGARLEGFLLHRAHAVVTATEGYRRNLLAGFPFLRPEQVHAIPNGFDPDDFPADLPRPTGDVFRLTYAGTVFRLTSPAGLLGAIRRLHVAEPGLARRLDVSFLGRVVETESPHFEGTASLGVRREGYLEHDEVLRRLAASHAVACVLANVAGAERILPAKIFELLRLGRPVLTLAPPGELADLVRATGLGEALPPNDESAIAERLEGWLRGFKETGQGPATVPSTDVSRFDRRGLAGEFADVFRQAVALAQAERAGGST